MKKRAKFRWAITSAKAVANLFYDLFPEEDKKLNQPGKCWEKKEARWFRGASRHPSRLQQQHLFCSEICCEENHCVAKSCDKYWLWNVWKWKEGCYVRHTNENNPFHSWRICTDSHTGPQHTCPSLTLNTHLRTHEISTLFKTSSKECWKGDPTIATPAGDNFSVINSCIIHAINRAEFSLQPRPDITKRSRRSATVELACLFNPWRQDGWLSQPNDPKFLIFIQILTGAAPGTSPTSSACRKPEHLAVWWC